GAFEIPFAVSKLLKDKNIDGVVTLGTVIKGGTDHDQVVAHSVARKLLDLSAKYEKPVALGISGPNITWEQARKRTKEYAERAVDTVIEVIRKN
ncbi:MAG TPA: 6,7-dimethyl-8-ribityllumazine synthase, partial [Candidatus Nanoarchaeia archaeon]|nr:6,7-dimethyl-8-ribityllumazine synthase [Candidatus Nanoarchaeia archaeon]